MLEKVGDLKLILPNVCLGIGKETIVEKCLKNFKENNIKSKDIIFASGFKENLIKKKLEINLFLLKIKIMKIQIWSILFSMQLKK